MKLVARFCFGVLVAMLIAAPAKADTAYTIIQSQSQLNLTVSGSVFGGALTAVEQNPTAITNYNGTINTKLSGLPLNGFDIAFPGSSSANAVNPVGAFKIPFQFQPKANGVGGSEPANYGVTLSAPVGIVIPPINLGGFTLDLGTLQSVDIKMALRNLVLDVDSTGNIPIGPGGSFESTSTTLGISSGYSDINGSMVFKQSNIVSWGAALVALNTLVGTVPDLGLSVSSNILQLTVSLGLGTRLDLTDLGGASLANAAATDGSLTYSLPSGNSTLTLPVGIALPGLDEIGIPPEILDLQLGLAGVLKGTGNVPVLPGDATLNGIVDGGDYTVWADNYLQTGKIWTDADFTDNGLVDGADYTIWADNYNPAPAMASAVPEPSTLVLSAIGLVGLVAFGWRRRSV